MSNPIKTVSLRKIQWLLFLLSFFKIPVIGFVRPRVLSINDESVRVQIKLRRRTKNHLKSMYFGALAVGADVAGGIHVFYFAELSGKKVSFAFKSMNANFIKRAESHIVFESNEGLLIKKAIELSEASGERINQEIQVQAVDASGELVATFEMVVSVKTSVRF